METVGLPGYTPLGGEHCDWREEALTIVCKELRALAAKAATMPLNRELCEMVCMHWLLFMTSVHNVKNNPEKLRSLNGTISHYARQALAEAKAFRALVQSSGDKIVLSDGAILSGDAEAKVAILEMVKWVEKAANDLIAQA